MKVDGMNKKLLDILWSIFPVWLGAIIYNTTGYIWVRKEGDGESIQYYFRCEKDLPFSIRQKNES